MRDPREVALNELHKRCLEAADLHEHAAGRTRDDDVRSLFDSLTRSRRSQASRLRQQLDALGELPEDIDADAEAFRKLVTAARTWLSSDENQALLAERARTEERVLEAADAALEEDLSPEGRALVAEIRAELLATRELLDRRQAGGSPA